MADVEHALARSPVVLLLGARQVGKTTLARAIASRAASSTWFDQEDPEGALRADVAKQVLMPLRGLVVVDECQRAPFLFPLLRVLADRKPTAARFLLLGSASPDLVKGAGESLAGRVAHVDMSGFDVSEVPANKHGALWLRGGFPRSFLSRSDSDSFAWRADFVRTFLERDIPQLGIRIPADALRRFWTMLAHRHGATWNGAELARSMGTGENAVRRYVDLLTEAFVVRQLPPYLPNIGKRLVKSPRIYLRDSGLLHYFLGIRTRLELMSHPALGASFEGFAVDQIIRHFDATRDSFFYRTQAGAELDLLITKDGRRVGFEVKHGDTPTLTRSMHIAMEDLELSHLYVVHPGERSQPMADNISSLALRDLSALKTSPRTTKRRP